MGLLLALFLLLSACQLGRRRKVRDEISPLRAAALAAWEARSDDGGLDRARDAWLAVLGRRPEDVPALTRLARIEWIAGHADPAGGTDRFAEGREYAWRCLLADPSFAAALSVDAGRLTRANLLSVEGASGVCLGLMAANTLGLVDSYGPGLWVELPDLRLVSARLDDLAAVPGATTGSLAEAAWLGGRLAALGVEPDLSTAEKRLLDATKAAPGVLLYAWSLGELVPTRRTGLVQGLERPGQVEDRVFYDRMLAWQAPEEG